MKKVYQTNQRKLLIDFLKSNASKRYTIEEISSNLSGFKIGKSTLYRLMNSLVEEGAVSRISEGNSRHFVYQIYDTEDCNYHMHLKCSDCGALIHLGSEESASMKKILSDYNGFQVDGKKTMIIGKCYKCKETGGFSRVNN